MTIKIDRDIPLPAPIKSVKDQGISRAMRELKPGESFYLEGRTVIYASRLFDRAKRWRPDALFVSRTVPGGVRIWCVSDPAFDMLS